MLNPNDIEKFQKDLSDSKRFHLQANLAKLLSDPTRLKILYVLTNATFVCPSDFSEIIGLSLPAISHQLAMLKQMGIVETVRHGQMICYSLGTSQEGKNIRQIITAGKFV